MSIYLSGSYENGGQQFQVHLESHPDLGFWGKVFWVRSSGDMQEVQSILPEDIFVHMDPNNEDEPLSLSELSISKKMRAYNDLMLGKRDLEFCTGIDVEGGESYPVLESIQLVYRASVS